MSTGVEALGLQSGLRDLGNNTRVTIAHYHEEVVGLGLAKHVRTRPLWQQAARGEGRLDDEDSDSAKSRCHSHPRAVQALVGVEYDQDSKTPEVQCPCTRCPRTWMWRAKWLVLRQQVCQAAEAMQHEVTCRLSDSRNASIVSPVRAVSCAQRAFSAETVRVGMTTHVIGTVVNVQFDGELHPTF